MRMAPLPSPHEFSSTDSPAAPPAGPPIAPQAGPPCRGTGTPQPSHRPASCGASGPAAASDSEGLGRAGYQAGVTADGLLAAASDSEGGGWAELGIKLE